MNAPNTPEYERFRATFKRRIAEITGTALDANGDLDEDALTIEEVQGAIALIQAEAVVYAAPERAEMEALDDEILQEEITELFFSMPEDDRNTARRLMSGEVPIEELAEMFSEMFSGMPEDEQNRTLRLLSVDDRNRILPLLPEDQRNTIRRLMHLNDEDQGNGVSK